MELFFHRLFLFDFLFDLFVVLVSCVCGLVAGVAGDGEDYLALTLRDGAVTLSINLGSGKLDVQIRPPRVRFDDNQWHRVNIHRKAQEVRDGQDHNRVGIRLIPVFFSSKNMTRRLL